MSRVRIPLGQTFGKGRSGAAGMQELVNMYAEEVKDEERTRIVCYGTPGSALFSTTGASGSPRGQIRASEKNYAVIGTALYTIASDGTPSSSLGEIEGSGLVDMSYNGNQIDIVADEKTYSLDAPTQILSEIVDPAFERACSATSLASYSIYGGKGNGRFRWRLTNTASFSGLDFATAEAEADQLIAVRKAGNEVVLLGSESTEWWYPTGQDGANAFAKTSTAAASIGCVSRDSAIVVDNGLTWVGRDAKAGGVSVYRAQGYTPQKISSPQVDNYLEKASTLSNLRAFAYQQRGHQFYALSNPGEWTLAWDILTNQWGLRKTGTWSMGSEPTGAWDCTTFALNNGKQIVGGNDGNLYELQTETYTENTMPIVRECTTPTLYHQGRRARMTKLELDVETGTTSVLSGQGSAPVVFMSHSDDNGHTWSDPRAASLGPVGQRKYKALWPVVGSYFNRIIKFRSSEPIPITFLGAWANIAVGTH